ncbi:MAG: glycosyltransferase [Candidatus Heimdallarchaeota archaeon]
MSQKKTLLYLGGPVDSISRAKIISLTANCSAMGKRGHKVLLFITNIPGFDQDIYEYFKVAKTFKTIFIPTKYKIPDRSRVQKSLKAFFGLHRFSLLNQIAFHFRTLFSVLKYKKKRDEKVVIISRDHYAAFLALLFSRFHRFPVIFESHQLAYAEISESIFNILSDKNILARLVISLAKKGETYILEHSSAFFSNTKRGLSVAKIMCNGKMPPGLAAPSGVFLEEFESVRLLERNPHNPLRLLYIGNIYLPPRSSSKGLDILLYTIARLQDLGISANLTIIGGMEGDPDIWRLREFISRLGIQEYVKLEGYVPHSQISEFMRECDLGVLPYPKTAYNSFTLSPLKMIEFLAAGVPVLVFDNPCIREIVENNKTAIIVDPNVESLVKAIVAIHKNPEILGKLTIEGSKIARFYDWNVRARLVEEFLERLENKEFELEEMLGREDLLSQEELASLV